MTMLIVATDSDKGLMYLLSEKMFEIEDLHENWDERTSMISPAYPLPDFDITNLRLAAANVISTIDTQPDNDAITAEDQDDILSEHETDASMDANADGEEEGDSDDDVPLEDRVEAALADEFEDRLYIDSFHTDGLM